MKIGLLATLILSLTLATSAHAALYEFKYKSMPNDDDKAQKLEELCNKLADAFDDDTNKIQTVIWEIAQGGFSLRNFVEVQTKINALKLLRIRQLKKIAKLQKEQNITAREKTPDHQVKEFASLPSDVKKYVFDKLDLNSICRSKQVCKNWDTLLSEIYFALNGVNSSSIYLNRAGNWLIANQLSDRAVDFVQLRPNEGWSSKNNEGWSIRCTSPSGKYSIRSFSDPYLILEEWTGLRTKFRLWNIEARSPIEFSALDQDDIQEVQLSKNSGELVLIQKIDLDRKIVTQLYETSTARLLMEFTGRIVGTSPSGKILVVKRPTIRGDNFSVWNTTTLELIQEYNVSNSNSPRGVSHSIESFRSAELSFSQDETSFLLKYAKLGQRPAVVLEFGLDSPSWKEIVCLDAGSVTPEQNQSPDGKWKAIRLPKGFIELINSSTNKRVRVLRGNDLEFTSDNNWIITKVTQLQKRGQIPVIQEVHILKLPRSH
jgi:hypothetical protein